MKNFVIMFNDYPHEIFVGTEEEANERCLQLKQEFVGSKGTDCMCYFTCHEVKTVCKNDSKRVIVQDMILTKEFIDKIKELWNTENQGDNPRIQAVKLIQREAVENDFTVTIKQATEILHEYCLGLS